MMRNHRVPPLASRLLAKVVPKGWAGDSIVADLEDEFHHRVEGSPTRARLWYWHAVVQVAAAYGWERRRGLVKREWRLGGGGLQDLRFAARSLRRTPGFTLLAAVVLALGIGSAGALFGLVDALFLRDLPVHDPDRLVTVSPRVIGRNGRGEPMPFQHDAFDGLSGLPVFSAVAGETPLPLVETVIDGVPEPRRNIWRVSEGYFDLLGIAVEHGRIEREAPTAILSDRYWRARFQGDPNAIGRVITVDDHAYTVTGVAPAGFIGLRLDRPVDVWLFGPGARSSRVLAIARLGPGVKRERAAAAVESVLDTGPMPRRLAGARMVADVIPAGQGITNLRDRYRLPLFALSVLVALVLFVTCINIGNLLVARNAARTPELAVRAVMGARRLRLIRYLLMEGVLLVTAGAGLAAVVAVAVGSGILSMLPVTELPQQLALRVDLRMLGALAAASLLSALLFSVTPAWHATRIDPARRLSGMRRMTAPRSRRRFDQWLVAAQVIVSVVLLTGAGLFVRTLGNTTAIDPGFDSQHVLHVHLGMPYAGYGRDMDAVLALYRLLLEELSDVTGVQSVSASRNPLLMPGPVRSVEIGGIGGTAAVIDVGPRFFATMGIPVLLGRSFTAQEEARTAPASSSDGDSDPNPLIVSQSFADRFFPGEDPLGKPLPASLGGASATIVGVAADARLTDIHDEPQPTVYGLFVRDPSVLDAVLIRSDGDPNAVAPDVQRIVRRIEPRLLTSIDGMDEMISRSMARERMVAATSAFFGALVLALAGLGLFGTASLSVARRTNEFGVRIALGAQRRDVIGQVLQETGTVFVLGLVAGTVVAVGLSRVAGSRIEGLLFGLDATDPGTLAAVALSMAAVGAIACMIPTLRALRIDPLTAIRHE